LGFAKIIGVVELIEREINRQKTIWRPGLSKDCQKESLEERLAELGLWHLLQQEGRKK